MQDLSQTAHVPWGWTEGTVPDSLPHFRLHGGEPEGPVLARVGLQSGSLVVQVLAADEESRRLVTRNLRLQVEKPRTPAMEHLGPWNYAIHHAETADNLYADVVWVDCTRVGA